MLIINGKDNDDSADNEYGIGGVIMRTLSFPDIAGKKGLFVDGDWIEKKDQDAKGKVRLIQLADIGSGAFLDKSDRYITEDKACELHCTFLRKGDVLIARLGEPICKCCLFPFEGNYITAVDVAILRIGRDDINPKYLVYLINSPWFKNRAKEFESGTTRKRISRKNMEKILLPFPSLDEQARIVARIEELFSELDAGAETLQKIKQQLSVYRQSALSNALKSIPNMRIEDCIESMGQGWSPKCDRVSTVDNSEWAVITTTAVQPMKFDFRENKKLPDVLQPREKHELKVGDILVTRAGPRSRCGICCMVRKTKKRLMNCDKVYRIRVKRGLILPEYLEAILNSPDVVREIAFCKTGGNDSGVNLTQDRFLSIWIPVPAIQEQRDALDEIASRMSVCDSIEKTVDEALQQSAAMRQSILKQAFEGGL